MNPFGQPDPITMELPTTYTASVSDSAGPVLATIVSKPAPDRMRARFVPGTNLLVYMQGILPPQDFWMLDIDTRKTRQLTRLTGRAAMRTFDITPDGRQIVFDRLRENSDIVLIDLPQRHD